MLWIILLSLCAAASAQDVNDVLSCAGSKTLTKSVSGLTSLKLSGDGVTIVETNHNKGGTKLELTVAGITDEPLGDLIQSEVIDNEWSVSFVSTGSSAEDGFSGAMRHGSSLIVGALLCMGVAKNLNKRSVVFLIALVALTHVLMAACANTVIVNVTTPSDWSKTRSGAVVVFSKDAAVCTCANGKPATGAACTVSGPNCASCNPGFSGATCVANVCTCDNGVAATGSACLENGAKCASCDAGFKLSGAACEATTCTCSNGNAATGSACVQDGVKCISCHAGFKQVGAYCVATVCTCSNGVAATGAACVQDGAKCASCNAKYTLSGTSCVEAVCTTPTTAGYTLTETIVKMVGFDVTAECDATKGYEGSATVTACTSPGPYSVGGCTAITCEKDYHVFDHSCRRCAKGTFRTAGDSASQANTACKPITCGTRQYVNYFKCVDCPAGTDWTKHTGGHKTDGGNTQCDASKCNTGEYGTGSGCAKCAKGYTNKAGDSATSVTKCDAIMCPVNHRVRSNACEPCPSGQEYGANADASKADTECVAKASQKTCSELKAISPSIGRYFYYNGGNYKAGSPKCAVRAFRHTLVDASQFVCTGADNPSTRASQGIKYAVDLKDWYEAEAFCKARSMRLCTDAETPEVARNSGCGFNSNVMWTSDTCTAKDGTKGHIVDTGSSSSVVTKIKSHPKIGSSRCVSDDETYDTLQLDIAVQCCSDHVLP